MTKENNEKTLIKPWNTSKGKLLLFVTIFWFVLYVASQQLASKLVLLSGWLPLSLVCWFGLLVLSEILAYFILFKSGWKKGV